MICHRFRVAGRPVIKIITLDYLPERPETGRSHVDLTCLPMKFSLSEYSTDKSFFFGIQGQRDSKRWSRGSAGRIDISSVVQPGRFNHDVSSAFSSSFIFSTCIYKGTANIPRKYVISPTFVHIPFLNDSCHTTVFFDENHSGKYPIRIENIGGFKDASGLFMKHLHPQVQYFRWLSPAMKVLQFAKVTHNSFHNRIPQNFLSMRLTPDRTSHKRMRSFAS